MSKVYSGWTTIRRSSLMQLRGQARTVLKWVLRDEIAFLRAQLAALPAPVTKRSCWRGRRRTIRSRGRSRAGGYSGAD